MWNFYSTYTVILWWLSMIRSATSSSWRGWDTPDIGWLDWWQFCCLLCFGYLVYTLPLTIVFIWKRINTILSTCGSLTLCVVSTMAGILLIWWPFIRGMCGSTMLFTGHFSQLLEWGMGIWLLAIPLKLSIVTWLFFSWPLLMLFSSTAFGKLSQKLIRRAILKLLTSNFSGCIRKNTSLSKIWWIG